MKVFGDDMMMDNLDTHCPMTAMHDTLKRKGNNIIIIKSFKLCVPYAIHTNTMIHRVSVRCSLSNVFENLKSFKVSVWAIQADINSAPLEEAVDV